MTKTDAQKILDNPESTDEERKEALGFLGQNPPQKSTVEQAAELYQQNEASTPAQAKQKGKKSKFYFEKKNKPTVSEDIALAQIEILFERYRIDIESMIEDDLEYAEGIESSAKIVLEAIMLGEVEIYIDTKDSSRLKVKQKIKHRSSNGTVEHIIYNELEGNDNASIPEGKKINNPAKMYALLGSLNEDAAGENTIRSLRSSDLKTAQALANLFLVP